MLHHVTGACCIQHTVSQTARTIFSFVLFHLFNILICLKFYCHFSAITPNWNLTKKKKSYLADFLQQNWFNVTSLNTASWHSWYYFWPIFRKCPVQILASMSPTLTEVFHGFYPLPPADTNTVPQTMSNHFFPPLFQFTVYWSPYQNLI